MDEIEKKEPKQQRYKDVDDKDYNQDTDISMTISLWYYWHTFLALAIVAFTAIICLGKVSNGLRVYDILGKPAVSKSTSKMWLNILSYKFSETVLTYPLYIILLTCAILSIYFILKVYTTKYSINFRFLEVKEGVLNQVTNQVDLFTIKDEVLERPIFFRILGLSRLIVLSNDKTSPKLVITGVNSKKADDFLQFIRTNAYGSSTEYWVAKDRRRRNEKDRPEKGERTPVDRSTILGDGDVDE